MKKTLLQKGTTNTAYDSEAMLCLKQELGNKIDYAPSQYHLLECTDANLNTSEWSQLIASDFKQIKGLLSCKMIFGSHIFMICLSTTARILLLQF
jgi:UDPglucose 6-dehydrogenase